MEWEISEEIRVDGAHEDRQDAVLEGKSASGLADTVRDLFRGRLLQVALIGGLATLLAGCVDKSIMKTKRPPESQAALVDRKMAGGDDLALLGRVELPDGFISAGGTDGGAPGEGTLGPKPNSAEKIRFGKI